MAPPTAQKVNYWFLISQSSWKQVAAHPIVGMYAHDCDTVLSHKGVRLLLRSISWLIAYWVYIPGKTINLNIGIFVMRLGRQTTIAVGITEASIASTHWLECILHLPWLLIQKEKFSGCPPCNCIATQESFVIISIGCYNTQFFFRKWRYHADISLLYSAKVTI